MRRPTFRPPLSPEHHGAAIVSLQEWSELQDARLEKIEDTIAQAKRWLERAAWGAAMAALALANTERDQMAAAIVKLLVLLAGG